MSPSPDEPTENSDGDIVERIKAKEEQGLQQLLHKYGGRVSGNLVREFRGCLEASDVEAAVSQAAWQAWTRIDTFAADKGSLGVWFFVIARNAALAIARKDAGARSAGEVDFDRLAGQGTALAHGTARAEDADPGDARRRYVEAVRECIQTLPRLQREVILADMGSRDVADAGELAKLFGTTRNSIYVTRSVARKNLKRAMQQRGFFPGEEMRA